MALCMICRVHLLCMAPCTKVPRANVRRGAAGPDSVAEKRKLHFFGFVRHPWFRDASKRRLPCQIILGTVVSGPVWPHNIFLAAIVAHARLVDAT